MLTGTLALRFRFLLALMPRFPTTTYAALRPLADGVK